MAFGQFLTDYITWHYQAGLRSAFRQARNLIWFLWRLFAPVQLIAHLFSPWRRLHEPYPDTFDLKATATAFIVNTLMRGVSAVVRLSLFFVGITVLLIGVMFACAGLLVWFAMPAVIGALIVLPVVAG